MKDVRSAWASLALRPPYKTVHVGRMIPAQINGRNVMLRKFIIVAIAALAVGGVAVAQQMAPPAQTAGLKRTVLQKFDVPAGERETVTAFIEIPANTAAPRDTLPCPEGDYLFEGDLVLNIYGQPPKPYKAGESFYIPAGTVHGGRS